MVKISYVWQTHILNADYNIIKNLTLTCSKVINFFQNRFYVNALQSDAKASLNKFD